MLALPRSSRRALEPSLVRLLLRSSILEVLEIASREAPGLWDRLGLLDLSRKFDEGVSSRPLPDSSDFDRDRLRLLLRLTRRLVSLEL